MRFQGALIHEQGVRFALVVVKHHVVQNRHEADKTIEAFQPAFPGVPVVLMGQDSRGTSTYYGRKDISRFMADVPLESVPWQEYTLN